MSLGQEQDPGLLLGVLMSFLRRAVAALASVIAVASSLLLGAAMAQTNTQPANASFETPSLPLGRTLTPAGASWTFAGTAGIERLQSGPDRKSVV